MKVILVAAISQNGFLTNGSENIVTNWTSAKDKDFFQDIKSRHKLLIMGRKTFEANAVQPTPGTLKLIMTRNPKKFKNLEIPGQLEFTDSSALKIKAQYEDTYTACLLLGGGEIYKNFLDQKCVDEMYITVEPVTFTSGVTLFENQNLIDFLSHSTSYDVKKLNSKGTQLYHVVM